MSEWISVDDRMPDDGTYLAHTANGTHIKILDYAKDLHKIHKFDFKKGDSGFYGCDSEYGYYKLDDVTHWMPLPEPPKGE